MHNRWTEKRVARLVKGNESIDGPGVTVRQRIEGTEMELGLEKNEEGDETSIIPWDKGCAPL